VHLLVESQHQRLKIADGRGKEQARRPARAQERAHQARPGRPTGPIALHEYQATILFLKGHDAHHPHRAPGHDVPAPPGAHRQPFVGQRQVGQEGVEQGQGTRGQQQAQVGGKQGTQRLGGEGIEQDAAPAGGRIHGPHSAADGFQETDPGQGPVDRRPGD